MENQNTDQKQSRAKLCSLKVTLNGITPTIWRRLICPSDVPLELLSVAIQEAFGWEGSFAYRFKMGEKVHGASEIIGTEGEDARTSHTGSDDSTLLDLALKEGSTFEYQYDFGDNASLSIVVEELRDALILEPEFGCRAGERAAPFEDCGGVSAWQEILAAKMDKSHPRRKEFEELYALSSFDPEAFDAMEVNERIQIELLLDDESRDLIYQMSEDDVEQEDAEDQDQTDENGDDLSISDKDARISVLLSVALTNQLMADEPKEVLGTLGRLIDSGYSEGDALAEVYSVFSDEFFDSQIGERNFDMTVYLKNLAELPRQATN